MSEFVLCSDGACENNGYNGRMSIGYVLKRGDEIVEQKHIKISGRGTNNQAEIIACLHGIAAAKQLGATKIHALTDSQLMARHYSGEYACKQPELRKLHKELRDITQDISFQMTWHRRESPLAVLADKLSKGVISEA